MDQPFLPALDLKLLQNEVAGAEAKKPKPEFKAAVGMSRLWDAKAAGRELAEDILKRLDGKKPDFILLFATIHYEKHGGFQEFLNGVWEILPKGTCLIGGTIMGFINPQGTFTRGATALAVSYPHMDLALGLGRNTKRTPEMAAFTCAKMIKNKLKKSKYQNKFLFDMISGVKVPSFPIIGRKSVMKSGLIGRLASPLFSLLEVTFQKGFGNEEEILDIISKELDDYGILHTSSLNTDLSTNYQFYGNSVLSNSVVCLGISTDLNFNSSFGCRTSSKKQFEITGISKDKRIITEINGKPASSEYLKLVGWQGKMPTERQFLYGLCTYFPIFFQDGGVNYLRPITSILGGSIVLMSKFEKKEGYIASICGNRLMGSVDDLFIQEENPMVGIFSSCAVRLMALGSMAFAEKEKLDSYFKGNPFILVFCSGEGVRKPSCKVNYFNESIGAIFIN